MTGARPLAGRPQTVQRDDGPPRRIVLLIAGIVASALSIAAYVADVAVHPQVMWRLTDLKVYWLAGTAAVHRPDLYDLSWFGTLQFTYPPFAALLAEAGSVLPLSAAEAGITVASVAALGLAVWLTVRLLSYRGTTAVAFALLVVAVAIWLQPVQRTLQLGQVNLLLMVMVIADLAQPDRRWWKGAGVGLAAGIKLTPLIFVLYLLVTGRVRQAAVAAGTFAATILAGFAVLPRPSAQWWLHSLYLQAGRTGFVGQLENQSLRALITRVAGSVTAGSLPWLVIAVLVGAAGLACAALLDRAGQPVAGVLACALTGLLVSPISWDHHWVWIVPGLALLVHLAARARGPARAGWWAAAAALAVAFGGWPAFWTPRWTLTPSGVIWYSPTEYFSMGDNPGYREYHWNALQMLAGNLYVYAGLIALAMVMVAAVRWRQPALGALRQALGGRR
jgi:alpha-1,2-mannosyltransferase